MVILFQAYRVGLLACMIVILFLLFIFIVAWEQVQKVRKRNALISASLANKWLSYQPEELRVLYESTRQSYTDSIAFLKDITMKCFSMLFLLNGSAAAGLLVFFGPVLEFHPVYMKGIVNAIFFFIAGAGAITLSAISSYIAQSIYAEGVSYEMIQIRAAFSHREGRKQEEDARQVSQLASAGIFLHQQGGRWFHVSALGLAMVSLSAFCIGFIIATVTLLYW